jgi:hypothetical protein
MTANSPAASKTELPEVEEAKAIGSDKPTNSIEISTADEYPHGLRLVVLVGAVMMTVFLTSLDQVSNFGYSFQFFLSY